MTPQHAGAASGVLAIGLQVGNALGVAVIGVVFYGLLPPGAQTAAGHNPGYGHAFGWSLFSVSRWWIGPVLRSADP